MMIELEAQARQYAKVGNEITEAHRQREDLQEQLQLLDDLIIEKQRKQSDIRRHLLAATFMLAPTE